MKNCRFVTSELEQVIIDISARVRERRHRSRFTWAKRKTRKCDRRPGAKNHFALLACEPADFALEAGRAFAPLTFTGREVACLTASATHMSIALWSAMPGALMANIPGIGLDGIKSQGRACGLFSSSTVVRLSSRSISSSRWTPQHMLPETINVRPPNIAFEQQQGESAACYFVCDALLAASNFAARAAYRRAVV